MTDPKTRFRVADLSQSKPLTFDLRPEPQENSALAAELGLNGLRKLSFRGSLQPEGKRDWVLRADLGATVTQPCVVTLAPVTTRLEEAVVRRFLADMPLMPEGEEVEMPEDDTIEPLGDVIDLAQIMTEALALALPLYPRADGAALPQMSVTEPGKEALTDDDVKPFAALVALRDKLQGEE